MTEDKITRKEAIKKMGKYAALTALGTYTILSPKSAQACSAPPCGNGWGNGGPNGNGPEGNNGNGNGWGNNSQNSDWDSSWD
jgi:hypothetical protein